MTAFGAQKTVILKVGGGGGGGGGSTEDYTTAEKNKLAGIAAGANNYTHPTNHPASVITQDVDNRFVTDAEKAAWNAKQAPLVSGTNLKTINGESLLGGGDLVVTGGGGAPDETLSAAAWRTEQKGRLLGRIFRPVIDLLFRPFERDHCRKSFGSERNCRHLPKEYQSQS